MRVNENQFSDATLLEIDEFRKMYDNDIDVKKACVDAAKAKEKTREGQGWKERKENESMEDVLRWMNIIDEDILWHKE